MVLKHFGYEKVTCNTNILEFIYIFEKLRAAGSDDIIAIQICMTDIFVPMGLLSKPGTEINTVKMNVRQKRKKDQARSGSGPAKGGKKPRGAFITKYLTNSILLILL